MSEFETESETRLILRCMFCGDWQIDYVKYDKGQMVAAHSEVTLHANLCVFGDGLVDLMKDELA